MGKCKHINPLQVFVCTLQSNKDSGGQDTASATGTGNVGVNTSAMNPMLSERIRLVNRLRQENISADCTFEENPAFLHQKTWHIKSMPSTFWSAAMRTVLVEEKLTNDQTQFIEPHNIKAIKPPNKK